MIKPIHDWGISFSKLIMRLNSVENLDYKRFHIKGEENFMPRALELSLG